MVLLLLPRIVYLVFILTFNVYNYNFLEEIREWVYLPVDVLLFVMVCDRIK